MHRICLYKISSFTHRRHVFPHRWYTIHIQIHFNEPLMWYFCKWYLCIKNENGIETKYSKKDLVPKQFCFIEMNHFGNNEVYLLQVRQKNFIIINCIE